MEKEIVSKYKKAGEIVKECQELAQKKLKEGVNLFSYAEEIEAAIIKKGGFPAFPINLSSNNVAAHYTPAFESDEEVGADVVKVDIGVHVDGYICDTAVTVDLSGNYKEMVEASKEALEKAVAEAKEGAEAGNIGKVIQESVKKSGFNPVQNLSGHGVEKFNAHTNPSIPNIANRDTNEIEEGMAVAIEPFVTDGSGFVREGNQAEIFQLEEKKPVRSSEARKIIEFIDTEYNGLPFAERWVQRELKMSDFARKIGFRELMLKKCITAFPLLKEDEGKIVTQAETTLLFDSGKVIRLF